MDGLGSCASVDRIKAALEDLPVGLDETYTRSLQGLRFHKDQAVRILQILLVSSRPLTVEEIYEVTSVNLKARPGYSIDKDMRMRDLEPLSCLMSSLIKRTSTRFPRISFRGPKGKGYALQIAHAPVRDYLLSENCEPSFQASFTKFTASAATVEVCLAYFRSSVANGCLNSFTEYSHESWVNLCRTEGVEEAVYDSILKFLLFNGFKLFASLNWQSEADLRYRSACSGSPLYTASRMGLAKTVRRLLEGGVKANEMAGIDGRSEAIASPNSYYQEKLIEYQILEQKEPRNGQSTTLIAQGGEFGTPLQAACHLRHIKIPQLLIENGADVNAHGGRYGCPLQYAAYESSENTVNLLLDNGADVNPQPCGYFGTPLQAACLKENEKIIQMLLDRGADVNSQPCENYGTPTPLHEACLNGSEKIIQMLLDLGADVNPQPRGAYRTPLQVAYSAPSASKEKIIQMLLDRGAR
ncbi:hypothetical protein SLS56_007252 [Neofusicoccum ribis]|uniref:Ankyrin n=1 Tax=Neofusicoccum ribis TaxID=45134 RepID=A0ABR3SNJ3_9PEZI